MATVVLVGTLDTKGRKREGVIYGFLTLVKDSYGYIASDNAAQFRGQSMQYPFGVLMCVQVARKAEQRLIMFYVRHAVIGTKRALVGRLLHVLKGRPPLPDAS